MCNNYNEFEDAVSEYFRTTDDKPEVAGSRLDIEMERLRLIMLF